MSGENNDLIVLSASTINRVIVKGSWPHLFHLVAARCLLDFPHLLVDSLYRHWRLFIFMICEIERETPAHCEFLKM